MCRQQPGMVTLNLQKCNDMQIVSPLGIELAFQQLGAEPKADIPQVVWAHGWMQSHVALLPLAKSLEKIGSHLLVDFPGFGYSPMPPEAWGTKDYAEHIAAWLKSFSCDKRIWVGHSFGCRVGIQIAALYPDLIDGLFLIAAPGLPNQRSLWKQLKIKAKIYSYKGLKRLVPFGVSANWLKSRFGSRDYQSAGILRPIFMKVVSEDLTEIAKRVRCPVHLVYGDGDKETPFYVGQRYADCMQKASFFLLHRYDHYSILTEGRYQVLNQLKTFWENTVS